MDWEAKDRERKKKIHDEKIRLLAISDYEAEKLPLSERYQRIRYLREIEAAEWLADLRRKLPTVQEEHKPYKRRYSPLKVVKNDHWKD